MSAPQRVATPSEFALNRRLLRTNHVRLVHHIVPAHVKRNTPGHGSALQTSTYLCSQPPTTLCRQGKGAEGDGPQAPKSRVHLKRGQSPSEETRNAVENHCCTHRFRGWTSQHSCHKSLAKKPELKGQRFRGLRQIVVLQNTLLIPQLRVDVGVSYPSTQDV